MEKQEQMIKEIKDILSNYDFDVNNYVETMKEKYYSDKEINEELAADLEFLRDPIPSLDEAVSLMKERLILLKASSVYSMMDDNK